MVFGCCVCAVIVPASSEAMSAETTENADPNAMYESLFEGRYTEREPGYAEVILLNS